MKQLVLMTSIVLTSYYFYYVRHKPAIYCGSNLKIPKSLTKPYYPLFWGWNAWVMSLVGQFKYCTLQLNNINFIEEVTLSFNQKGRLVWINSQENPDTIVVCFHGVMGDTYELTEIINYLSSKEPKWSIVSFERPGHVTPLSSKYFNTVGFYKDVTIILNHIKDTHPLCKLTAVAISAGTSIVANYTTRETNQLLSSMVLISPGYTLRGCFDYFHPLLSYLLTEKAKYFFVKRHKKVFSEQSMADLLNSCNMKEWHSNLCRVLSYENIESYYVDHDPCNHLDKIGIPTLFINSYDDMLFPKPLIEKFAHLCRNPNHMVVHTKFGGHCCFYQGFMGSSYLNDITLEFIRDNT